MAVELYNDGEHVCLAFTELVEDECSADKNCAVQCNQFLVVDHGQGLLIDPGGNMTFNPLVMAMQRYFPARRLAYLFGSHQDPDIVASLNKWLVHTEAKALVSRLWARFVPHFCTGAKTEGRIIAIPDEGMNLRLGKSLLKILPAHFLHSEGNFQIYDPVARILFSGDVGASLVASSEAAAPVTDFAAHLPYLEPFHRRIMNSNRVARLWVNMVRELDIEWLVPQHGRPLKGRAVVRQFLDWFERLECGMDLMQQKDYRVPDDRAMTV